MVTLFFSLADTNRFTSYTSPVCLAIAFYFAEKKFRSVKIKSKFQLLGEHIHIASAGESTVFKTLETPAINDFEDGLAYYSAIESKCNCIITEEVDDFSFSKIEVLICEDFFKKYLFNKKKK